MSSKRMSLGTHFLSSKKKNDLTELFTSFDKDNDGRLSSQELDSMLKSAGLENPMKDKTDSLDFEEFAKLMRPTLSDPHRLTKKQKELKEAFEAFDTDGDGVINVDELKGMMEKLGDKITLEEAKELIQDIDLDKDGVVNFTEFCTMMGIQVPNAHTKMKSRAECSHHHSSSLRRFFCSHK